ncbi:isochorismatase family cysteine hydrolase [Frankia sp. AgB32]|uniref:cysteine hydrolase family protein n=1 Tax=Frankia sp. AgB32 TaxID=631119 RepID=UPI00200CDE09|nr:isochorismatase family cysteine hydrolase [Frankia sp. AgB32]MCK9893360.1 cysteine hydrolase [Frankia sp. AgB32]
MNRWALLTIDVQNDFSLPCSPHAIAGTDELVPTMASVVAGFRAAGLPIVHVVRLYQADGSNAEACRRPLLRSGEPLVRPGTPGSQLRAELHPRPPFTLDHAALLAGRFQPVGTSERVLYKPRWGAFFGTGLDAWLRARGVEAVAVVGANFPNCPRMTVYEASERDFQPIVVADAISGIYPRGIEECAGIGARALSAAELLADLAR